MFKKALVFTDLHLGYKGNSQLFNNDCLDFLDWAIAKGKKEGCDVCFFLGDFHHHRATINIHTLNASYRALEKLDKAFPLTRMILGNHDLYYRDKRTVSSIIFAKKFKNIEVVTDMHTEGDVCFVPWLVGDDHHKVKKVKAKYMFGHFELPHFLMNAMIAMPDSNEIKREELGHIDSVFTGHFHKKQQWKNISYIGNCFPHNYADAGDDDRGIMILEWGKDPVYHAWPSAPNYRVMKISELLHDPHKVLASKGYVRAHVDIEINYEESAFLKETLMEQFNLRELSFIPNKSVDHTTDTSSSSIMVFHSVDQIVANQLTSIESDVYDSSVLLDIYRNL